MSECVCELSGFCTVRQLRVRVTHQMLCQKNKLRVDRLLQTMAIMATTTAKTVSALSARLLAAIETATGVKISCNELLQYLTSLNVQQTVDCEEIVTNLIRIIPPQSHMREKHTTQQEFQDWLTPIVTAALLEWIDADEANVTLQNNTE